MVKPRRNALPPLPGKYRDTAAGAPTVADYGFRGGAFLLSLAFLVVGAGTLVTGSHSDAVWTGLAVGFIAVFVITAISSRGWSDRPLSGLRRLGAELQFVVLGAAGVAVLGYMGYALVLVVIILVAQDSVGLLLLIPVLAILLLIMRKTGTVELMKSSLSSATLRSEVGTSQPQITGKEHTMAYIEALRHVRMWGRDR